MMPRASREKHTMYIIKAIYPQGGHTVMFNGEPLRFKERQEAVDRAEVLNATTRNMASRNMRTNDTSYIVVEDTV